MIAAEKLVSQVNVVVVVAVDVVVTIVAAFHVLKACQLSYCCCY